MGHGCSRHACVATRRACGADHCRRARPRHDSNRFAAGKRRRAEAAIAQEAQQARAAASFADDVPQALANLPDPPPRAQFPDDLPPPPVAKSQVVTEEMDLATLELPHSQPVSGSAASQGDDARRLFVNTIPEDADALRAFDEWRPGMGGSRSKNVLNVVTHEGKLVISPLPRGSARGAWGKVVGRSSLSTPWPIACTCCAGLKSTTPQSTSMRTTFRPGGINCYCASSIRSTKIGRMRSATVVLAVTPRPVPNIVRSGAGRISGVPQVNLVALLGKLT